MNFILELIKKLVGAKTAQATAVVTAAAPGSPPPPPPAPPAPLAQIKPLDPTEVIKVGVDLIKHFEGLRLYAYQDQGGVWTIGWGATGPEIVEGVRWTEEQADAELTKRIKEHACYVPRYTSAPLSKNQMAALTSFCYNLGPGNLKQLISTSNLDGGQYERCAANILAYNKVKIKQADGSIKKTEVAGLTRRRKTENRLFLTPDSASLVLADILEPVAARPKS